MLPLLGYLVLHLYVDLVYLTTELQNNAAEMNFDQIMCQRNDRQPNKTITK